MLQPNQLDNSEALLSATTLFRYLEFPSSLLKAGVRPPRGPQGLLFQPSPGSPTPRVPPTNNQLARYTAPRCQRIGVERLGQIIRQDRVRGYRNRPFPNRKPRHRVLLRLSESLNFVVQDHSV